MTPTPPVDDVTEQDVVVGGNVATSADDRRLDEEVKTVDKSDVGAS